MQGIRLEGVTKSYDGQQNVIEDFDLAVADGEFLVLLGPSGCGKSTLLRIIAGLESVQVGRLYIDGEDITDRHPKDRDIAMVFQNYALYPHMTVAENIGISMQLKRTPKAEIEARVAAVADTLAISDLLGRKPAQLSGGQMQRVALARAIVRNPKAFLMDEPLSNLDAKLRTKTRAEIVKLHRKLGVTTVYVTHDQIEAMTMATTIVLMHEGKILQKGAPNALYRRPDNLFTARFIGSPEMNLFETHITDGALDLFGTLHAIPLPDGPVIAGIRSEDARLSPGDGHRVTLVENLGSEKLITLTRAGGADAEIIVKAPAQSPYRVGDRVALSIPTEGIHLFDPTTERRLVF
ncbi:multiple sugar transport system ATP-binding protein [Peptoniphilus ivorii]|uniref:ABC transporter ATP-binding protein n=1 Tax=Aedoeadaptatus ivorii TaxID=54006 RepID=UPI0027876B64|nr:ABC transporter ATP-binding protein [Peptoniphilus ivorii]MDQ0508510.1 multiple sugar transport system ATP-binding protein [Peptoniphilus ivorii]